MKKQIKKFHQLSLDEWYEILQLRVNVFVVEQSCPYPELDNKDQEADHMWFSEENKIVSYLRIYYPEQHHAAIGRVVTHVEHRGQGISRKMMEEALLFLKKQNGIAQVYLQAQEYLIPFYTSFGFQQTSPIYKEDGLPHVDMTLEMKKD